MTPRRAHRLVIGGTALVAVLTTGLAVQHTAAEQGGGRSVTDAPPGRRGAVPGLADRSDPAWLAGVAQLPVATASPARVVRRTVRIMPLGDSITRGVGSARINSYRLDLDRRLQAAGFDVDFVGSQRSGDGTDPDHEGHSGWTIMKIADRVQRWLAAHRPDVVLLHIGTNDMSSDAAAAEAPTRLDRLLRRIRETLPYTEILLATLVGAKPVDMQRRIDGYNHAIRQLAGGWGPYMHLVDQSTVDGLDIRDGLHPNDVGYAKMAFNWYTALGAIFGDGRWPVGVDPYRAREAYRCLQAADRGPVECHWYRDGVIVEDTPAGGPFLR